MDVVVRYWNNTENEVKTRYFSSVFLNSTKALDLKKGLIEAVGERNLCKIIQVSMDGPAVNFCMLKQLKVELSENHPLKSILLDIGSCGLHNIHGAFKTGIKKLNWEIDQFFRHLYYLFKDSPARRAHYIKHTMSNTFPLKFCSTRWVENQKPAERANTMLPHLRIWVDVVEKEGKKNPLTSNNQNYQIVLKFVTDKLAGAKLAFFISIAAMVEPFLIEFQSDDPLAPFLYEELTYLTHNIMTRTVKKDVLEKSTSIIKVEMKNENLIPAKEIDLGFQARGALKNAKPKPSDDLISQFRKDCRNCYIAIIQKIQERSPLLYRLTRYISSLDPTLIDRNPALAQKRLDSCLELLLTENMWITGSMADKVKQEYNDICRSPAFINAIKTYNRHEKRLDYFWIEMTSQSINSCQNLIEFLKIIFIMSHGNAALERGFSINANSIIENQTENSLVGLRVVYNAVGR